MQFNVDYRYFYTFLKHEYERTRIDFKFLRDYKCKTCRSTSFENGTCIYCQNEYPELRIRIKKIEGSLDRVFEIISKLGIREIPQSADYFNELCELVLSDKNTFDKSRIQFLLRKLHYDEVLTKSLKDKLNNDEKLNDFEKRMLDGLNLRKGLINPKIVEKIKQDIELTPEDVNEIEKLLSLGLSDLGDIWLIANYVIKDSLLKKKTFSYKTLEQAFLQVATSFANEEKKGVVCTIEDAIENPLLIRGDTYGIYTATEGYPHITILREVVVDLYEKGDTLALEVMFHEINHLIQDTKLKDSIPTKDRLLQAIDRILGGEFSDYTDDNYFSLSYEIESRVEGYAKCQQYLEILGIKQVDEYYIYLNAEKELAENESDLRKIDSKEVDFELFFNDYIKDKPELLTTHPILNCKYKITPDGYGVVLKDADDLKNDFNDYVTRNSECAETLRELHEFLYRDLKRQEFYLEEQRQNETSNKKS